MYQRRQWQPTPVLLPGKSHGWRSLVGCSPWSRWGSDTTERLDFHFSLSCIGEGNGNPLQCSCQENPRDGGAWWAAVYGVAQSRTRLKRLSSSSSKEIFHFSLATGVADKGIVVMQFTIFCLSHLTKFSFILRDPTVPRPEERCQQRYCCTGHIVHNIQSDRTYS